MNQKMKKLSMAYEQIKPKKRSTSVLPLKYRNKTLRDKNKAKSNILFPPKIKENFFTNNNINKNKTSIYNSL